MVTMVYSWMLLRGGGSAPEVILAKSSRTKELENAHLFGNKALLIVTNRHCVGLWVVLCNQQLCDTPIK